ncbi:mycofactocin biosynthesis peptidyl-dipeptidase MftE [Streptomyces sp. NPDC007264]|uniref:mycofactocin biosynthesis peptidyl-dipeptidase MftE n=1 Tax=Streptomyces sp. NPDC007264 TaxID=3364777 RepID=UPI0036DAC213
MGHQHIPSPAPPPGGTVAGRPSALLLGGAVWPQITDRPLVLVPVGSTEQHGPHLPLDTDTTVATAVAHASAALLAGSCPGGDGGPASEHRVLVAPALAFGASGEHAHFPGTVSIGREALRAVLVETVRSLALWAGRCVFVNGHGGNAPTLDGALAQMRTEQHDVAWLGCGTPGGDAHAGRTETSLMLHLAPHTVRLDAAAPGDTRPVGSLMGELIAGGVRAVSPNGVLGDPTGASAAEGAALFEAVVASAVDHVRAWRPDRRARLAPPAPGTGAPSRNGTARA